MNVLNVPSVYSLPIDITKEASIMASITHTPTANSGTDRAESPVARLAGHLALVAGGLFTAAQLVTYATVDRGNLLVSLAEPIYLINGIVYFVAFCLLLIAVVAAYGREAHAAGTFGVVGVSAAIIGTMALGANVGWFEVFAVPWIAEVAPDVIRVGGGSGSLAIGGLSSYVLFAIGWVLFGSASLRAGVFPASICVALVAGGLVGFVASVPPFGVPLGLAVAWLGGWMLRNGTAAGVVSKAIRQTGQ